MNLDDELKTALSRLEPPAGFAERVLARIEPTIEPGKKAGNGFWNSVSAVFGLTSIRWAAAAVVLCVIAGAVAVRIAGQREEAARSEAAKEQLMLALGVASEKMNIAQRKISEISNPRKETEPAAEPATNRRQERRRTRRTSRAGRAGERLVAALRIATEKLEAIEHRLVSESGANAPVPGNE